MTRAANVDRGERLRLFCALRLPDETLDRIAAWQGAEFSAVDGVRRVRRDDLHVTLAFLGSRPAGDLRDIAHELREAAREAERPLLAVRRYRETRSVGMLVFDDRDGRVAAFAADVHERLERLGVYERERRPWLAHVTVLRFRRQPRLTPRLPDLGEVSPSEAAVYHSLLRPTGAQYEVLDAVALGG